MTVWASSAHGMSSKKSYPSWMDLDVAPGWYWEAVAAGGNKRMQAFNKDGNIRMLLAHPSGLDTTACWKEPHRPSYIGVISGVFKNKGAAPWAITKRPEVAALGLSSNNVIGWLVCRSPRPVHWCVRWEPTICTGCPAMTFTTTEEVWRPKHVGQHPPTMATFALASWNLRAWLVSSLWEKSSFSTQRSNRPGDDMKDELRTDGDPIAWRAWSTAQNQHGSYASQLHP